MRVLSGIQPTGRFHWGNYFGAIRQYISLQDNEQAFYFIADLHALTTIRDPKELRDLSQNAAIDLLALGLDPNQATLFRQSDISEVTDLTWILMTLTQKSLLEKCHAYKDKVEKGIPADAGLFTYPVLMAADILLYDSDVVPVGADQQQHIEVTRDIAQRFNSTYGDALNLPNAHVLDSSAKVPGTDGEKMSKSYNNTIAIFGGKNQVRKPIMSIKTDSKTVEDPKDPSTCAIFDLYKLFSTDEQQAELAERYQSGGLGYGDAKKQLYEASVDYFAEATERRAKLVANLDEVEQILEAGAARARAKAQAVLGRVKCACGL